MDAVDATTLSYEDFCARYMAPNRPVLLRNVTDKWFPKAAQWRDGQRINFKHLKEHYGPALAPVVSGDVEEYGSQDRWTMRLDEYLDLVENGTAGKKYLKDWHFVHAFGHDIYSYGVRLFKIYSTTPPFFKDDWLNWWWDHKEKGDSDYRFVYLGELDVIALVALLEVGHRSTKTSFVRTVNVCGRKEWVFFHPDDESKLKDSFGRFVVPDVTRGEIDCDKYPRFHEAKPIYVIQETGDAIFVPSGWYHQVKNLEDTISINHNWFNGYNVRELWGFFKREYAAVEHELEDLKEMGLVGREFDDQCQLVMLANTGINYVEFRELLYAKTNELLAQREHPEVNDSAAGRDLLRHLGYTRDILHELNAALRLVDGDAKVNEAWLDVDLRLQNVPTTEK
ncbi:JmjC domain-containing protein 4 [Phytophthora citrophthora]|uniref:JmjC domain-containing protein 4 n=1 Tax=Phytophthora citrophthora TaxID=4793 RepID=A0AAD9H0T5_9STRA|nr:JmjC domain-containing protein 4 [Phytophthora citrophthora]